MPAQTVAEQILDWKTRRGRWRLSSEIAIEIGRLRNSLVAPPLQGLDPGEFVVIRLVTLIEVFVRETVRYLVDAGPPYVDRAEPLARGAKLDFFFAKHMQGQRLTLGDFVAHTVPISSLDQVIAIFDALLPGYRGALKTVAEPFTDSPDLPIIRDLDAVLGAMARVFELRHILVHEHPRTRPGEVSHASEFVDAAEQFVSATNSLVTLETEGRQAGTQAEMNASAGHALQVELDRLRSVLSEVAGLEDVDADLLKNSQRLWEEFANAEAQTHAHLVDGGTMYPMIYAVTKAELVRLRVEQLSWWLTREEGEL